MAFEVGAQSDCKGSYLPSYGLATLSQKIHSNTCEVCIVSNSIDEQLERKYSDQDFFCERAVLALWSLLIEQLCKNKHRGTNNGREDSGCLSELEGGDSAGILELTSWILRRTIAPHPRMPNANKIHEIHISVYNITSKFS